MEERIRARNRRKRASDAEPLSVPDKLKYFIFNQINLTANRNKMDNP